MNQKILSFIIIAVVAVIVVIGLWISGVGQTAPLEGCIDCSVAPQQTTLTLDAWVNNEYVSSGPERKLSFGEA